jgi:hypothetical protein
LRRDIHITKHGALFVGHDGYTLSADLQPEHERGYGVAGFVVGRAFVSASPAIHCISCVTGNHRWPFGPIAKPIHKTAKITYATQADNR